MLEQILSHTYWEQLGFQCHNTIWPFLRGKMTLLFSMPTDQYIVTTDFFLYKLRPTTCMNRVMYSTPGCQMHEKMNEHGIKLHISHSKVPLLSLQVVLLVCYVKE